MSYKSIITTLLITKVTEIETAQSSQISLLKTYVTDYDPEKSKHALFLLHQRGISRGASSMRDA